MLDSLQKNTKKLKIMMKYSWLTDRWLSHPSKAPCCFAREWGNVHRGISRRIETSLWVPVRRERQLLKSYEQSGHSENGVWLSWWVPSCKQSYGGLEHQLFSYGGHQLWRPRASTPQFNHHNDIHVASTSPARASDRSLLSLPHHLTAGCELLLV